MDTSKPVILCVGHHSAVGQRIGELLREQGIVERIELVGLCCTAYDMARAPGASVKIVGNQRDQLRFARAGIADVVVADQQCIRLDLKDEVLGSGACFVGTSEQACAGVLGDIPGIVAFLACPDYPDGRDAVAQMVTALAQRGYIVLTAGCAAMDLPISDSEAQPIRNPQSTIRNPYQVFPGTFDQGGVVSTGSCVSAVHAIGAAIKVAAIFLHRPLAGNYAGIADYILNRVGVVGVLWGGVTPKALAAAAGANRLGIPVLFGPQGTRFRRTVEGNPQADRAVYDARTRRRVRVGLAPVALCTTAATREEALVQIARLCLRANDTTAGRQVKLHHYIELSRELLGHLPDDLACWVRSRYDIPPAWEEAVHAALERDGWEPAPIPDPTLVEGQVRQT